MMKLFLIHNLKKYFKMFKVKEKFQIKLNNQKMKVRYLKMIDYKNYIKFKIKLKLIKKQKQILILKYFFKILKIWILKKV